VCVCVCGLRTRAEVGDRIQGISFREPLHHEWASQWVNFFSIVERYVPMLFVLCGAAVVEFHMWRRVCLSVDKHPTQSVVLISTHVH
jgi:hypothetical protein